MEPRTGQLPWVHDGNVALLTDRYELTMLQAYFAEGLTGTATFSLFVRSLPRSRNFLLACGLDTVLGFLEGLHFPEDALAYLASTGTFDRRFLAWLGRLRFTGDVRALPEGTPFFPEEPILEIDAPLPEAQLVETFVMNQLHLQTVLASKAVRLRLAAGDRQLVDFGLRRAHGADAGLKGARAFHVAGIDATSNVLAGRVYGVPVAGTMAHSYVQAHDDELGAFRAFARSFPETILLVDSYDTLEGVRNVVRLARELGPEFGVRGIRLDSGELGELAAGARRILDGAGLRAVRIFASGGLDEWKIWRLVNAGAPIDAYGVGTALAVSEDAPALDIAYKLTEYAGKGRLKCSAGKRTLPGRKQLFRQERDGQAVRDLLGRAEERLPGRPLLQLVMEGGRRCPAGREELERARRRTSEELSLLPAKLLGLEPAEPAYPVELSAALALHRDEVERELCRPAR